MKRHLFFAARAVLLRRGDASESESNPDKRRAPLSLPSLAPFSCKTHRRASSRVPLKHRENAV